MPQQGATMGDYMTRDVLLKAARKRWRDWAGPQPLLEGVDRPDRREQRQNLPDWVE